MASKDKGDEKPRKSGGFLGGEITDVMRDPHGAEPSEPSEDPDGLRKAVARFSLSSLPSRVKRLEKELKELKRRKSSKGRCKLWKYVALAKEKMPTKVSDHAALAVKVDSMLETAKQELKDVCPKSWRLVKDLPRLLSDALNHPELKRKAAVLISQAR